MASGLEQTRRNSAILGCLNLSSISPSFSTFLKFAFPTPAGRQPNQDQVASIWDRTTDWIGLRIGSDWYFRFLCRGIILRKAVFNNDTGGSEQEIRALTKGV